MFLPYLHRILANNFVLQQFCKQHGYVMTEPCLLTFSCLQRLAVKKAPTPEEILAHVKEQGHCSSKRLVATHLEKLLQQGLIKKEGRLRYAVTQKGEAALGEIDRMLEKPQAQVKL